MEIRPILVVSCLLLSQTKIFGAQEEGQMSPMDVWPLLHETELVASFFRREPRGAEAPQWTTKSLRLSIKIGRAAKGKGGIGMLPIVMMCLIFAAPMITLLMTAYTTIGRGCRRSDVAYRRW
jgi:hypothetical protein